MEKVYLEDYGVGEVFQSPRRTITESDIHSFAALTGDWHPLHTDAIYAAETPFGERIAHGFLTLVIGSALIFRLGPYVSLPKTFIAFYGLEKVRFTAPVKIGDTIDLKLTVIKVERKDNGVGVLTSKGEIRNQHGEVCCSYIAKLACKCRSDT